MLAVVRLGDAFVLVDGFVWRLVAPVDCDEAGVIWEAAPLGGGCGPQFVLLPW